MPATLTSVGLLGGGNMATAIIAGLRRQPTPPTITVVEPVPELRARHATVGCRVGEDPALLAGCQVVVLAVKPQVAAAALAALRPHLTPPQLVVSIMAGLTCTKLAGWLPAAQRLVRTMPNTPLAIGQGMVGMAAAPGSGAAELDLAEALFAGSGAVLRLTDESQLDAVTAVSGSGPAFLFRFAEAQVAGAKALGFSQAEAELLVGQTLQGSIAYLMAQDGFPAARLREQVTSPGGTTAAGLKVLDAMDPDGLLTRIYQAARDRGRELAGG